jgi:hypothetical protein
MIAIRKGIKRGFRIYKTAVTAIRHRMTSELEPFSPDINGR